MGDSLQILPKTVREILKIDNDEIINLCQAGDIPLKTNEKGLTYFTTDDVKTLKKLQDLQNKAVSIQEKTVQLKNKLKKSSPKNIQLPAQKNDETVLLLKQITGAVKNIETGFYDKFSAILEDKLENKLETKLEEKLGGIDAVIMDLVRCKTEADDMRKKIAEQNKQIYSLKNELSSFKKVAGNIYIKKTNKQILDI